MTDSREQRARSALRRYTRAWHLRPDGKPFQSLSSWLLPVRWQERPAMLKLPFAEEERAAIPTMGWFDGDGAAAVIRSDDHAQLLERLADDVSLVVMVADGNDLQATEIICAVVARLHLPRQQPLPDCFVPIRHRFEALRRRAAAHGQGLFQEAWSETDRLLSGNTEAIALHGDIHHLNILHDPVCGWVAIDPKGIFGPRGYDYANIFCNPDLPIARSPDRLRRQVETVSFRSGLEPREIAGWALAHAALSASWSLDVGQDADLALAVAESAQRAISEM